MSNNNSFIELNESAQLDELFTASDNAPVILFKHSVSCPISHDVYEEVAPLGEKINLVIVQKARAIADAIAEKTGIRHESPQAIILRHGKAVYHASHYDITAQDLENAFEMAKV